MKHIKLIIGICMIVGFIIFYEFNQIPQNQDYFNSIDCSTVGMSEQSQEYLKKNNLSIDQAQEQCANVRSAALYTNNAFKYIMLLPLLLIVSVVIQLYRATHIKWGPRPWGTMPKGFAPDE